MTGRCRLNYRGCVKLVAVPAVGLVTCDWNIYADFAHRLIAEARRLYADDSLGSELTNTVYALD